MPASQTTALEWARRRRAMRRALSGRTTGLQAAAITATAPPATASPPAPAAVRAPGLPRAAITLCRRHRHITARNAAGIRFAVTNGNHGGAPRTDPATKVVPR
jgi:hypothetical protein